MSRRVLLVDADVDALGALASALRARGILVANASDAFEAVEQAFQSRPDVVLVDHKLDRDQDLTRSFEVVPELAETPVLLLVPAAKPNGLGRREILRTDIDLVISRIAEASPRESRVPLEQELRGNIEQMPMVDIIQLLAMNRRSGVLGITTSYGAGEIRLAEGAVIDAVYRRLEGEKAFYRLLGERAGRFAFSPGEPATVRRLTAPAGQLLMEAMRQIDEVAQRRRDLAPGGEALMLAEGSRPAALPSEPAPLERDLVALLQIPRSIDELLDELPATDLVILDALVQLDGAGRIRRIPIAELNTPFAAPEQLAVLRSLVSRLTRPGFTPPPRLVIAAGTKRMPALAYSVRRISEAVPPNDAPPRAALMRPLGTLRLGDGIELALTGLPADETFAPTWALALPGAAAVVRLNDAGGAALEAHCEAVEVMLIDAESVMGAVDVAVPAQVAALVRSALEVAAGV